MILIIKYRSGRSNQAGDTLRQCPKSDNETFSDCESDGYETIWYAVVCNDLCKVIKGEKLPLEITKQVPDSGKVSAHSEIKIKSKVTGNFRGKLGFIA